MVKKPRDKIGAGGVGIWNYRIVKRTDKSTGEDYYGVHECFYDADGKKPGWTENPVSVISETPEGIKWVLDKMALALDRPIIDGNETK